MDTSPIKILLNGYEKLPSGEANEQSLFIHEKEVESYSIRLFQYTIAAFLMTISLLILQLNVYLLRLVSMIKK